MSNDYHTPWSKVADDVVNTLADVGEIGLTILGGALGGFLGSLAGPAGAGAGFLAGTLIGNRVGFFIGEIARQGTYDLTHKQPMYSDSEPFENRIGEIFLESFSGFGDLFKRSYTDSVTSGGVSQSAAKRVAY